MCPPPTTAPTTPALLQCSVTSAAQFEALLLEELDVEATAMLEVPEEATDFRM